MIGSMITASFAASRLLKWGTNLHEHRMRECKKTATGNPKVIAEFVLIIMEYAASRSENDIDDKVVEQIRALLDPDGDGKI